MAARKIFFMTKSLEGSNIMIAKSCSWAESPVSGPDLG